MTTRTQLLTMVLLLGLLMVSVLMSGTNRSMAQSSTTTTIVDTGQETCYDDIGLTMTCPAEGEPFHGQDAQYAGAQPSYTDNGDGTITDTTTGLMWQQTPGDKVTFAEGIANADTFALAGYTDWRVPTIKELYSLIDFRGITRMTAEESVPYIDTTYFNFAYGDISAGERFIDAQYMSSTAYVSTVFNGVATVFGVNFADGRIKGYPQTKTFYLIHVRGNSGYGENSFVEHGDSTVTDNATGLMWQQADDGTARIWEDALAFCESLDLAGYDDWRLPNAKELQGIVDYTRSPDTTNSPAIDPVFGTTSIIDGNGNTNYPYFWTSTTHVEGTNGDFAVYIAFGEALGYMEIDGETQLLDVHGAGAQRSDPKRGDPADYPDGFGPQGDVIGIDNYARCVRNTSVDDISTEEPTNTPTEEPTDTPTDAPTSASIEEPTDTPTDVPAQHSFSVHLPMIANEAIGRPASSSLLTNPTGPR